jgi:Ca2+-binding EF-hand superfamily protein
VISKEELRQGFATLEIGIKYDEINDLMRLITTTKDGKISYDDFITKMDANIRHRRGSLAHLVED